MESGVLAGTDSANTVAEPARLSSSKRITSPLVIVMPSNRDPGQTDIGTPGLVIRSPAPQSLPRGTLARSRDADYRVDVTTRDRRCFVRATSVQRRPGRRWRGWKC